MKVVLLVLGSCVTVLLVVVLGLSALALAKYIWCQGAK